MLTPVPSCLTLDTKQDLFSPIKHTRWHQQCYANLIKPSIIWKSVLNRKITTFYFSELGVPVPSLTTKISILGIDQKMVWKQVRVPGLLEDHFLSIRLPDLAKVPELVRSQSAWTIRMSNLMNTL